MATLRQKHAMNNLVENGGNIGKAMRDAGYTEATAKTPQKLTESKGFKELYEEMLPDNFLAEKHRELLSVSVEVNSQAVSRGLDMAYKLKGHYAAEKKEITGKLEIVDNSELDKLAEELDEKNKEVYEG